MTTIAYRGGVMAADTAMTRNGLILLGQAIKIKKIGPVLVGGTGDWSGVCSFLDWASTVRHWDDIHSRPKITEDCTGIVIEPDSTVHMFYDDEMIETHHVEDYIAFGSGAGIAMGALWMGASPEQAVQAAMTHDPYTTGKIIKISF